MLVLGVKVGEPIHIGPDITLHVFGAKTERGTMRIGFDAPRSIDIWRGRHDKDGTGSVHSDGVEETPAGDGDIKDGV